MDIELARTFLEILRCRSFSAAAESLCVTQTTVTMRMHKLEERLGCRLMERNRSGVAMTPDGERFAEHASRLVQTWETAQRELPLPQGIRRVLALGGELSLWDPLLTGWLHALRESVPQLAVRIEVGARHALQEKLTEGVLDAVLVHQADYWPSLQVELLQEERLVMVRTPGADATAPYLYVDWGELFRREHDAALPQFASPVISVSLGPLALHYLLNHSGMGYFRLGVIQPYLQRGMLERVVDMPEFSYPVYLVHPRERRSEDLDEALALLRRQVDASGDRMPR